MKYGICARLSDLEQDAATARLPLATHISSKSGHAVENPRNVERAGDGLSAVWPGKKFFQHSEIAGRIDEKNHPAKACGISSALGSAAKIAVSIAQQTPGRTGTIGAASEAVKDREPARCAQLEHGPEVVVAGDCNSVEIGIRVTNQTLRPESVAVAGEAIEDCLVSILGDFEDGATASCTGTSGAAELCGSVKLSVDRDQPVGGRGAVCAGLKVVDDRKRIRRGQLEHDPARAAGISALRRRAEEIALRVTEQSSLWNSTIRGSGE